MAQQRPGPGKAISFTRPPVEFGECHNPLKRIKTLLHRIYFWQNTACNNSANGVIQIGCALYKNMRGKVLDTFCYLDLACLQMFILSYIKFLQQVAYPALALIPICGKNFLNCVWCQSANFQERLHITL